MGVLDTTCFEEDLTAVLQTEEAARWNIRKSADLEVTAAMSPKKDPGESYVGRLRWDRYPGLPSLKFLDPSTGAENNPRAWPQCGGFRPTSLDSCVMWTKEGHALHPEWANAPQTRFDPSGNALFRALNLLQHTLDCDYNGRFKG